MKNIKKQCTDRALYILFWASWDEGSNALKNMMEELPNVYRNVRLAYVDTDMSGLGYGFGAKVVHIKR